MFVTVREPIQTLGCNDGIVEFASGVWRETEALAFGVRKGVKPFSPGGDASAEGSERHLGVRGTGNWWVVAFVHFLGDEFVVDILLGQLDLASAVLDLLLCEGETLLCVVHLCMYVVILFFLLVAD